MEDEYIIISKTAIQKRIEELENFRKNSSSDNNDYYQGQIKFLKEILSQSIPLIPELKISWNKAIETVQGTTLPEFNDFEEYISNLKLDI